MGYPGSGIAGSSSTANATRYNAISTIGVNWPRSRSLQRENGCPDIAQDNAGLHWRRTCSALCAVHILDQ